MSQWSEAEGVIERTQEASGAMANAYELYTDSIEGRINTLKATLQGLSSDILDDSIIKAAVSGLTGIANALDFIIDKLGIIGTLAAVGGIAKFVSTFKEIQSSIASASMAISGITSINEMASALSLYDANVAKLVLSKTSLNAVEQKAILIRAQEIQQNGLISASYFNQIAAQGALAGGKSTEITARLSNFAAANAEAGSIDAVTVAQIEDALTAGGVDAAKSKEIAARYANAAAAQAEGNAISIVGIALKRALSFLSANPWLIIAGAILSVVAAISNYNKQLKENVSITLETYNKLNTEVETLESELTKVRDRLKEIAKIENPDIATQEEISALEEKNKQLSQELAIKQALKDAAQKEAEDAALVVIDKQIKSTTAEMFRSENGNVTYESYFKGYIKIANEAKQKLEEARAAQASYANDITSSEYKQATSDADYWEKELERRVKNMQTAYKDFDANLMPNVSGVTDSGREIIEAFDEFESAMIPFMEWYNGKDYTINIDANVNTDGVEGANKDLLNLMETIDALSSKFDVLSSAQEEFNEYGLLSSSTLSSIAEKYPALVSSIEQYALGLKTSQELLNDLSSAYQTDEDNYRIALVHKYENSVEFYNSLTDNQKLLIDELGEAYGVDLENFTTIEQKKLAVQKAIIEQMATNYGWYVGTSLESLKAEREHMLASANPGMSGAAASSFQKRLSVIDNAIAQVENVLGRIDSIASEGISGPSSWNPSKIEESASSAKDEVEDLYASIRDWFSDMEFKVSLKIDAGDIEGSQEMYKQMIERVNEELSKAYKDGLTINDDWVQELIQKLQEYNKALSDLVIEEYDKIISYNDDFDVWNKVSYSKLDVLADKLKKINDLYLEGILSYKDWYDLYMDTAKEIYDYQKDALEELLDQTMDAIKAENDARVEALENQKDAYNEIISLKKKLIEDTDEEADYEREVAKRVKEIAKLQERITQLALDDSREAYAERVKLEEELQQKQEELADYQADHAKDQVIDSLDEQQDKFEENIDNQIDSIKNQIDTEVELREQAIAKINADYKKMMEDIKGYFQELGITLDDEIIQKLAEGLKLIDQYGSYGGAIDNIGSGSIGDATGYQLTALIQQMKNNSSAWWDAKNSGNSQEMSRLVQENERIAQMLKTMFGLDIWKDDSGTWYIRTPSGKKKLFDTYHTGGVVDGYSTSNNKEIMALLEKGEVVFNDGQQKKFVDIFKNAAITMQRAFSDVFAMTVNRSGFSPITAGTTYAPNIEVNIEHNGPMTDDDANKYANQIGNGTFDVLMEIMNRKGII